MSTGWIWSGRGECICQTMESQESQEKEFGCVCNTSAAWSPWIYIGWEKSDHTLKINLIKVWFTSNKMHLVFKSLMSSDKHIHLCNCHPDQNIEHFHHPRVSSWLSLESPSTAYPGNYWFDFYHYLISITIYKLYLLCKFMQIELYNIFVCASDSIHSLSWAWFCLAAPCYVLQKETPPLIEVVHFCRPYRQPHLQHMEVIIYCCIANHPEI